MLEGFAEGLWSSLLFKAGLTLRSDQVAQGLVQLHFEYLPGWRGHNLYVLVLVLARFVVTNSSPKS